MVIIAIFVNLSEIVEKLVFCRPMLDTGSSKVPLCLGPLVKPCLLITFFHLPQFTYTLVVPRLVRGIQ
jgi:hypothetical protein